MDWVRAISVLIPALGAIVAVWWNLNTRIEALRLTQSQVEGQIAILAEEVEGGRDRMLRGFNQLEDIASDDIRRLEDKIRARDVRERLLQLRSVLCGHQTIIEKAHPGTPVYPWEGCP